MNTLNFRLPKRLTLGLIALALAGSALSADMPKRKAGLWEISTHMEGMPSMGAIQQCIDQNTDNMLQQQAQKESSCSVMEIKPQGNRIVVHSVCKMDGTTATTDGVFTGSFDSSYKSEMKIRYSPPMHGMSEAKMSQEARWLGACKPGQKPGDIVMPNMGGMNMNDPKMKEMMKNPK